MVNKIKLIDELGQNFIDFSYEANSSRAFADARDGLKPGQRACLWEMYHKKYFSNKPHVKSAKISGGVTGTWWPHGDIAIYDTFTRMSQKWINNIPEVDWHGNNGSQIIPDAAAASRYTEARLAKIAEAGMFSNIEKQNVNMILNYSEDEQWPEVLPAIFPRLIVNGCQGIGSTLANVWLPHNFKEIGQTLLNYITNNNIDYNNIFPDFPTAGIIINKNDISQIYKTGKGKVILRARAKIVKNHIFFSELPYQVYLEPLIDKIKTMVLANEISGIEAVYNRSSKNGIQLDIECLKDHEPSTVLKQLYKKTDLQKSYNANQWALVGKTPKLLNLKEYFDIYVDHNIKCIVKECKFDLTKAQDRLEIVAGLLKALEDIDNIISLIKKSENAAAAKENLIAQYKFTENQAKAILAMRLSSLAKLEKIELEKEAENLTEQIKNLQKILANRTEQENILKLRLSNLVKKYGDERRTELLQIEETKEEKPSIEIVPEDVVVVVDVRGNIKRIPKKNFKVQHRRGTGVKTDKAVLKVLSTNTVDSLMLFTSKGKMYRLAVDKIPERNNTSDGVNIKTILPFENDEYIQAATAFTEKNAPNVIFFTKKGLIKKTAFSEYSSIKKTTGIQAIKIKNGDELLSVNFMGEENVLMITKNGMVIKIPTDDIRAIGRLTSGVKGIGLKDGDEVVAAFPVHYQVGIITTSGKGKKINSEQFTIQMRGGRGVSGIKLEYGDYVAAAVPITLPTPNTTESLLIVGKPNSICIPVSELTEQSKLGSGTKVIERSVVLSAVKI